jgi:hypothetical protein
MSTSMPRRESLLMSLVLLASRPGVPAVLLPYDSSDERIDRRDHARRRPASAKRRRPA